jgi:signal transduction histidine kinase/CheY-like chemotaxis protein
MAEQKRLKVRFQAKILIPVAIVVGVFLGGTIWMISGIAQRQLREGSKLSLANTKMLVTNAFERYSTYLVEQFNPKAAESSFYQIAKPLDRDPTNPVWRGTMLERLTNILDNVPPGTSIVLFTDITGQLLVHTNRAAGFTTEQFLTNCAPVVMEALSSKKTATRMLLVQNSLLDLVAVPSFDPDQNLLGSLVFGVELNDATVRQLKLPNSEMALIARNRVVASSFYNRDINEQILEEYRRLTSLAPGVGAAEDLSFLLQNQHYGALPCRLPKFYGYGDAGYLLLSSYEQPWKSFSDGQRDLLLFSVIGIILSTTIVWFVVRRVTEPLRQLRDSAEAIGRGDFSRRIDIRSGDELGELAAVFNQTTENLQQSTEQLGKTVETLRTTQAQLIHSEKLSAVGEFVAGVAHELNNPLTALIGFSELVQMSEVDEDTRTSLKRISNSAERCHKIVQSLLSFSRQRPPERKLSNVNTIVDSVVEILIYELRTSNIKVVKELSPQVPRLLVDPHQLQQVFLNIVNNARQAIEAHRSNGAVRISTRVEGRRVQVRFQDDGPGITEENLKKIFNPFFTTKPVGKGTGLGLSLSYGIIQEHGGSISAESAPGQGTTFIIDLPITEQSEAVVQEAAAAPPRPAHAKGRKILVVDDEEDILMFVGEILRHAGYEVKTATDGEKALGHLRGERFDLIISDWKMPGIGGQELYQRLLESDPQSAAKMIFMTGDVLSEKVEKYLSDEGKPCLAKPFSMAEFHRVIDEAFAKQK